MIRILDKIRKNRILLIAMASIVVVVTTYMLILPALTLEKEAAKEQGGIDIEETEAVAENKSEAEDIDADGELEEADSKESADGQSNDKDAEMPEDAALVDDQIDNDEENNDITVKTGKSVNRKATFYAPMAKAGTRSTKPTIGEAEAHKALEDNGDGTYTLSLNVTAQSAEYEIETVKKSNVLFIMDRSSSMNAEVEQAYIKYDSEEIALANYDPNNGKYVYGYVNGQYIALDHTSQGWQYSRIVDYVPQVIPYQADNGLYYRLAGTRFTQEQVALNNLIQELMAKNAGEGNEDNIEIAVMSFSTYAGTGEDGQKWTYVGGTNTSNWGTDADHPTHPWGNTDTDWIGGTNPTVLNNAVNDLSMARGTNWEEALVKAKAILDAKKRTDGTNEDYYVVFLTDGAPTATSWSCQQRPPEHEWGAWYGNGTNHPDNNPPAYQNNEGIPLAYDDAKDDAAALVNSGYKLYNIFTYGTNDDYNFLVRLTNYAYSDGNNDTNSQTSYVNNYFTNATNTGILVDAFKNIFSEIAGNIGHAQVKITDGLTSGAMTSTFVNGKPSAVRYLVTPKDGQEPIYTVTVAMPEEGTEPIVTFTIDGNDYSTTDGSVTKETNPAGAYNEGDYYSVIVDGKQYKMALASVTDSGELTWNLTPLGILMNDCTYTAEFVVWPNQNAYNYVAGLENGLSGYRWTLSDEDTEHLLIDSNGNHYWKGGVPGIESIIKYKDGPLAGHYAVLTNTHQELTYSIVSTEGDDVTVSDPIGPINIEYPDPMPLTDSLTKVEKEWHVERDPGKLAQLLYGDPEKPLAIDYDIYNEDGFYKSVHLGWDAEQNKYVWESDSVIEVTYKGEKVDVGTRWAEDFAIATGLMLSETRMDELKMNKADYDHFEFEGTNYYILETGHDYTIQENLGENEESWLTYNFDFISPVYHPMLIDGKLKNVTFIENDQGEITGIKEISTEDELSSLKVENTLRGYLNVEKDVVDKDGKTPLPDDETKFKYRVDLHSDLEPGPFTDWNICWYGISGLFYHDNHEGNIEDRNYYQLEPNDEDAHYLTIETESGEIYDAWCKNPTQEFDKNSIDPVTIIYDNKHGGTEELTIYGNLLNHKMLENDEPDPNNVWIELEINQNQVLSIANVPVDTQYTVTELTTDDTKGYDLVSILREVRNYDEVESSDSASESELSSGTIEGTIVADRDNRVTYTNKIHSVDITVKKTDGTKPLTGAEFTLTKAKSGEETEDTVITKPGNGEIDTGIYHFNNLLDGTYTLSETHVPEGYEGISGSVTFHIEDGEISDAALDLPDNVSFDFDTLTFTVKNEEIHTSGQITVHKEWQDIFGDPDEAGADEVTLTMKRKVDVPQGKKLNVIVKVGNNTRVNETWDITHETANISWYDNRQYNYEPNRATIETSDGVVVTPQIDTSDSAHFNISNLKDAPGETLNVTINYFRSNESWIAGFIRDFSISGSGNEVHFGGDPVEDTTYSQAITLNADNRWADTITGLPTTDNSGNAYHYYIVEESVPDGYEVSYSNDNESGVTSGVLTAYNRKNTVDLSLEKVNKNDKSVKLGGAEFTLTQLDPTKTGTIDTRTLDGGKTITQTTSEEESNKGTLTFSELEKGYYEIRETKAPIGYILEDDPAFYIRITESKVQLLKKNENTAAEDWEVISSNAMVKLGNKSMTVNNTPGPELPSAGGPGTTWIYMLGALLALGCGILLVARKRMNR